MVYNQKKAWECGNYAYLLAMQHAWSKVTEEQILALPHFLTHKRAKQFLTKAWYIKNTAKCISMKIGINYLRQWYYLVAQTSIGNFDKWRKHPHIVTFDWDADHFFVIKEYIPEMNMFLCQNSWGPKYGMNWDFYIEADSWGRLWDPVRIYL